MAKRSREYVPAAGYKFLTSLYDPLVRWTMPESRFKRALVDQAHLEPGHRVLDLACGTGTLTILAKQAQPRAEVTGIDGDPRVLRIAATKAAAAGAEVRFQQALSLNLPFANGTFDRVLSSLFFHHLSPGNKSRTLEEVLRVVRPGGELHVADWGKPRHALARAGFLLVQLLDGFETTRDHARGRLPGLLEEAGFDDVRERGRYGTVFGTLVLYSARRADA